MKVTVHAKYYEVKRFDIELEDYEVENLREHEIDNLIRDKAWDFAYDYGDPCDVAWEIEDE